MTQQVLERNQTQPSTILIVEDDTQIQSLLVDMLGTAGYVVASVSSGRDALDYLDNDESVDLVLLDVMLPDMDGTHVCEYLRQNGYDQLPIIMLTALGDKKHVVQGLQRGADDYVIKPFFPDELLLRIHGLIRQHQEAAHLADENVALHTTLKLLEHQVQSAQDEMQTQLLMRKELLHSVTVHLQSLAAIVEAELRRLPPGIEREAVYRLRGRVRGAALVYQVSDALQDDPVEIGHIISMTASALKSIYRPWKRVRLDIQGEPLNIPTSVASPLAMITNELVTNCFKHAFPENRFGEISIVYGRNGDIFTLDVRDNGVGMPSGVPSGNGCTTVAQMVQTLHGTIDWLPSSDGTQVTLRLPIPQQHEHSG